MYQWQHDVNVLVTRPTVLVLHNVMFVRLTYIMISRDLTLIVQNGNLERLGKNLSNQHFLQ